MNDTPPWTGGPLAGTLPLLEDASEGTWDSLVLGSGGAACFAALELARGGARVGLVYDALHEERLLCLPGLSLPCLADHYWSLAQGVGREQSQLLWRLAAQGCQALREQLQPQWSNFGSALLLAVNPTEAEELSRGLAWMKEDGFESRMMGSAASSNYAPINEVEAALFLPGAATFDPSRLQAHLLESLRQAGVACFQSAVPWKVQADPLALVSGQREIAAESLVVAKGLDSLSFLGIGRRLTFPMRGQTLLSSPILQGLRSSVVALSANRGHEMYRDFDQRFIVSGVNPGAGPAELSAELTVDPVFCERLLHFGGRRLNELETADVERRWATLYDYSQDGLPLIGTLAGQSRIWLAAGLAGTEWSLGVAAGQEIGRALRGQANYLRQLSSASPRRFS